MDTEGERGCDELGDGDWHICTIDTMHKIDNQWEPAMQLRELCSGLLNGKETQERRVHVCTQLTHCAEQQEPTQHRKAARVQ